MMNKLRQFDFVMIINNFYYQNRMLFYMKISISSGYDVKVTTYSYLTGKGVTD